MRIVLFDIHTEGHHAEYASHIIKYLLECNDEVTFATSPQASALERFRDLAPSLQIRSIPSRSQAFLKMTRGRRLVHAYQDVRWCCRLANAQRVDVLHHLYVDGSELAWLGAPRPSKKTCLTFATLFGAQEVCRPVRRSAVAASLTSMAKRSALKYEIEHRILDGLFVDSTRARRMLLDVLGADAADRALTVVPNPAHFPRLVLQAEARVRLGLPSDPAILLFFGGLRREKGPDILLRALASVPGDWTAVIAGEPQSVSEHEVRELVAGLPNPSQVILRLAVIPEVELDDYFAAADAVVLPYRRSFGKTSGVLMKAAAAGRPVVAFDVEDVGQIVRDHQLGIVVPPESADSLAIGLTSYLSDRDEVARAVAPRAVAYARQNEGPVMAAVIRDAYLRQLSARRGTPREESVLIGHA